MTRKSVHGMWNSRLTFILAATGSAVGLGNIWKFPYITGENGGGAFVLIYLFCIVLVGVPIMMAEVLLGRRGRQSPINTMKQLVDEAGSNGAWRYIGWMGAVAGFLILSYYSVIAGWAMAYVFNVGSGSFNGAGSEFVGETFNDFVGDPKSLLLWHSTFMLLTMVIVANGIQRGLELAVRILMPCLFVLLIIMMGYGISTGSFMEGFRFLFAFDFSKLSVNAALVAMGHAFFTLSLGMGAIMAYGSYMPKKASIGATVMTIAALDTIVALVAGLAIFPIVFANGLEPSAGPGLMFVTLPLAFGNMAGGQIFGVLFFVLVSFAALTSSISLIEPAMAWAVEKYEIGRAKLAVILGLAVWLLGIATILSFSEWAEYKLFGFTAFDALDFLTANIMLPLGGLFIALFVGWSMKRSAVKAELNFSDRLHYSIWEFVLRYISPAAVFLVFVWTLYGIFWG